MSKRRQLWLHMMPRDKPLFASFVVSSEGRRYEQWQFDLGLGPGTAVSDLMTPAERHMAKRLTQFKADAVGYIGNRATLFEVKPLARLSALGQLLGYRMYFCEEYGPDCGLELITDSMTEQMAKVLKYYGITYHVVPDADDATIYLAESLTKSKIIPTPSTYPTPSHPSL